ncbi:MAG: transcription antitermination factor NusB [[Eubacterium] sulci]|nr:transcription antitermination factor NusB [[Eubacterium] sulci]
MTRQNAREIIMQILYQLDVNNEFDIDEQGKYLENLEMGKQEEYFRNLLSLVCNKKSEIDEKISDNCRNWTVSRMPKTDLAVLRLAVCEILFLDEMPDSVSINEAVELAKKYGEEKSSSYINGILGSISRSKEN